MNIDLSQIKLDLRNHLSLCQELLAMVERERQALKSPDAAGLRDVYQAKRTILPQLDESLAHLRAHRESWRALSRLEKENHPEISALFRQNQDLIMKIIVFDRENEQSLLRRGLLHPRDLPAASHRPQYAQQAYRRQAE